MPSELEFHLPLSREDLLRQGDMSHYVVLERCSAAELNCKLDACSAMFSSAGPKAIVDCFDVFFSLLQGFLETPSAVREHYWSIPLPSLAELVSSLGNLELINLEPATKKELRNTLKMLVYIVTQLVDEFENEATKPDSQGLAARGVRGRKGGARKKGQSSSSTATQQGLDWAREREKVLEVLSQLVELEVVLLWDTPSVPVIEDFSNLIAGCCYKLLENQSVGREKALKEKLFHLLATLVKKYGQTLSVSLKLIQLLQHFEHLVSPIAQAVALFVTKYDVRSVLSEMVRELGGKSPRDLALDNSGTRSFAAFLVEISQSVPDAMLPNLAVLLPHLHGESYTFRNGVLSVLGEVVCKVLSSADIDPQMRSTRDQLLDTLEEHVHDVNAFVRSKTLQIWIHLCTEKAIPLPRQQDLLRLVSGRLKDKSSSVRKYAVQLLRAFLASNPFAAKLRIEDLENSLNGEETKLKALLPDGSHEPQEVGGACEGGEGRVEEAGEVLKQMAVVQYLRNALSFTKTLSESIPIAAQLLGSKVISDVLEALQFLATSYSFEVRGSHDAVRKALVLVWSREQQVKEAVVSTYVKLYLDPESGNAQQKTSEIVRSLLSLVGGASYGDLASLEELIAQLSRGGHISPAVVRLLWDTYTLRVPGATEADSRSAIQVLSMAAEANRGIVTSNLDILMQRGLTTTNGNADLLLAKLTCQALQKLADPRTKKDDSSTQTGRLPRTHPLFAQICAMLLQDVTNLNTSQWCPFAEQAVVAIFKLSEQPDGVCGELLRSLAGKVFGGVGVVNEPEVGVPSDEGVPPLAEDIGDLPDDFQPQMTSSQDPDALLEEEPSSQRVSQEPSAINSIHLSRLLFAVGHVAQCTMVHIEESIAKELKRRRMQTEEEVGGAKLSHTPSTGVNARTPSTGLRTASKLVPGKTPGKTPRKAGGTPDIEEELGLAGAAAEDLEAELVRRVMEEEVGGKDGLLLQFEPIIVAVVTNPSKYHCPRLQASASLTLAKFMLLSSALCDRYLQLLFTILEKSPQPGIRANTIIAVGDLTFRFPNLTEPWIPFIYARLRDSSALVRKNAMTTLTHLILNDMIKVKGQISEMALCLEDAESDIADLAKLFFHELAKKGNSLYNILPDVISHLSDPQRGVASKSFRSIMKYLFSFIQKERQCESLIEKLLHRFRATRTDEQCHNLAHCLTEISFSERCLSKLSDKFSCYQDKLVDQEVYRIFTTIITKAKKSAKPDTKTMLEELERKLQEAHTKGLEDGEQLEQEEAAAAGGGETGHEGGHEGGHEQGEEEGREIQKDNDQNVPENYQSDERVISPPQTVTPVNKKPRGLLARSTVKRKQATLPHTKDTDLQATPTPSSSSPRTGERDSFATDVLSSARKSIVRRSTGGKVPHSLGAESSSRKRTGNRNRHQVTGLSSEEEEGGSGEGGEGRLGKRLVLSDSGDGD